MAISLALAAERDDPIRCSPAKGPAGLNFVAEPVQLCRISNEEDKCWRRPSNSVRSDKRHTKEFMNSFVSSGHPAIESFLGRLIL